MIFETSLKRWWLLPWGCCPAQRGWTAPTRQHWSSPAACGSTHPFPSQLTLASILAKLGGWCCYRMFPISSTLRRLCIASTHHLKEVEHANELTELRIRHNNELGFIQKETVTMRGASDTRVSINRDGGGAKAMQWLSNKASTPSTRKADGFLHSRASLRLVMLLCYECYVPELVWQLWCLFFHRFASLS